MPFPALTRRRTLRVPTLVGGLAFLVAAAAVLFLLASRLYPFLAPQEASGAELLVVEGWMGEEAMDEALAIFRAGGYRRIATSGGPITVWGSLLGLSNYADLGAELLRRRGVPPELIAAVPAPASAQDRTYLSAVCVRDWAQREGLRLRALDVLSLGPHARRTQVLYQMAFGPGVRVGIRAAGPSDFSPETWWRSSAGAKAVLGEVISLAWTGCCFWPGPPGSAEERWALRGEEGAGSAR